MEPRLIGLQKSRRLDVEMLEERIAPHHNSHMVVLPTAAAHGAEGIDVAMQTAQDTPGWHHKAYLVSFRSGS
jgi:hypothetical protein